ncbi:MAG: GGDEF domain-containing protein, partial [Solirubrobacterales bacterium]
MLYLAGVVLVVLSVVLPHAQDANTRGLCAIAGFAAVVGGASLLWPDRARPWMVHAALAAGTGLVSLCIFFAGIATGLYSPMYIWVVLLAASFFSRRAVAAHLIWIVFTWGLALALVDERTGFTAFTRWTLGSFVLTVTAAVMTEIVLGRRLTDEQLRGASHLANHDALTGLPNRRLFDLTLARELARARRQGTPLALVALDLDKFKEYHDGYGHMAGDQLLR